MVQTLSDAAWQAKWRSVCMPLPGSAPYRNVRRLSVAGRYDGLALIEFLCARHPHVERHRWQNAITSGAISIGRSVIDDPRRVVRGGNLIEHDVGTVSEPPVNTAIRRIFEDNSLLAVDKPAPLAVHPSGRFNKNTLVHLLSLMSPNIHWRPVHRLDADVSGVQLLAKTQEAARALARQFAKRSVEKRYRARVLGHPPQDCREITSAVSRLPTKGGGRALDKDGLAAATQIVFTQHADNGTASLELKPVSGRTHQLRVHLASIGHPICGDHLYTPSAHVSASTPGSAGAIDLVAWSIRFSHPVDGRVMELRATDRAWWCA